MLGRPFTQEPFLTGKSFDFLLAVESYIYKDGKKYISRISLPGIEVKDVEIHAQGNVLTIKGERKVTRTSKDVKLLDEEINYGLFERMLTLPEGLLVDKLTAEYHNGVLEITAPVAAALPRKIEIKTVPIGKQMAA